MQFLSLDQGIINTQLSINNDHLPIELTQSIHVQLFHTIEKQAYIPYTGCLLEHIVNTSLLSNKEKLFYLLADSLALISSKNNTQHRYTDLASINDHWTKIGKNIFDHPKELR